MYDTKRPPYDGGRFFLVINSKQKENNIKLALFIIAVSCKRNL